jgi:hypothetical protein
VPRSLAALLVAVLLATVAIGCGDGDDAPSSGDVPSGAVATVGGVEVSEQELDREVAALARARSGAGGGSGSGDKGKPSVQERKQLESQALSTLLQRRALEQEAADRGVEVDPAEVRQRWEAASKAQFKSRKALRRFLGGQTQQDVLAQLRLQLLAERIHEQVSEKAGGGKKGAKAVEEFQKDFQKRWADRTACRDGYTAASCTTAARD